MPPLTILTYVRLPSTPWPLPSSLRYAGTNTPSPQSLTQGLAIIPLIRYQALGPLLGTASCPWHLHLLQDTLSQSYLRLLSTFHHGRQGDTLAIGDYHQLAPFASTGQSHGFSPLLAGTKVPSKKARLHSTLPCSSKRLRKVRHIFSHTPWLCHSLRRLWQVESLPYSLGRSHHLAPVRSTHRMPFKVRLSSALGLPFFLVGGRRGAIRAHWLSVKSPAMAVLPSCIFSHSLKHLPTYLPLWPIPNLRTFGIASKVEIFKDSATTRDRFTSAVD